MEPGLGKTVVALTVIHDLLYDRMELSSGEVVIVAPPNVINDVWATEVSKWPHLNGMTLGLAVGTPKQRAAVVRKRFDAVVVGRDNFRWLVEFWGSAWPYRMLVWDESSDFKRVNTERFKAARKVAWGCEAVPPVEWLIELTGSPTSNGMVELWPQFYLLDRGERLGRTLTAYRTQHFEPTQFNRKNPNQVWKYGVKSGHDVQILAKLGDVALSMRKADWLTLPPLFSKTVPVQIGSSARAAYRELERKAVLSYAGGAVSAVNAAVLVGKLAQAANGAVYDDAGDALVLHDAKLDALNDLVDELAGARVLVFYGYKHDLARLKMRFPYAVAMADNKHAVVQWNRKEVRMLLAHPKSAGHGLNLQEGGNHMVWFSLPWSLELYQQANARLHRSGQKNTVILHHLVAQDTVDEQIVARLNGKQQTLDQVMDAVRMRTMGDAVRLPAGAVRGLLEAA